MHNATPHQPSFSTTESQINWLEMARFAADGQGYDDLGSGILHLAHLAAAVHRNEATRLAATGHQAAGLIAAVSNSAGAAA